MQLEIAGKFFVTDETIQSTRRQVGDMLKHFILDSGSDSFVSLLQLMMLIF